MGKSGETNSLWWAPWLALCLGLIATALLAYSLHRADYLQEYNRFANDVRQTEDDIERRIETYVNLLIATRELYYINENITKAEFSRFVNGLRIRDRYPGIQGVGFSLKIGEGQAIANPELLVAPARPIWPQSDRTELHTITALEPLDYRNERALGFDMFSQPVRKAAMVQSRDTGQTVMSGQVTLVQEVGQAKQPGFLLYTPVYMPGLPKGTEAERRAALIGFVYSPFRAGDFFMGIFGRQEDRSLDFQVYDKTPEAKNLLWDSNPSSTTHAPKFRLDRQFKIPGNQWLIAFRSRSTPRILPFLGLVPITTVFGLSSSMLLFYLLRGQIRARSRAELAAEELRTQQKVTLALAQVQSLSEALAAVLEILTENQAWDAGLLWIVDEEYNLLRCKETWSRNPVAAPFLADSVKRAFPKGHGIPGRVWESGRSFYAAELKEIELVRKAAVAANLVSCLAFPILLKNKVYGVVEVFSSQSGPSEVSSSLYLMAETIGAQMAQVGERLRVQQQLRESEQLHRTVTDAAADGLITIDENSIVLAINPAASRIFGFSQKEIIGRSMCELIPERFRERHAEGIKRFLATRTRNIPWNALELPGLHKSGKEIPLEISFGVTEIGGKTLFTGGLRDITERKKVEESRRYAIRQSALRAEVSTAFATHHRSVPESLQSTCEAIVQNLDVSVARAWILNTAKVLELHATAGTSPKSLFSQTPIELDDPLIGKIAREGVAYYSNDPASDPLLVDQYWLQKEEIKSFAGFPLKLESRSIGVVAIFSRKTITDDELTDFQSLMDLVAQGVERKRAEATIKQLNEDLERKVEERTRDMMEIYNQMETFTYSVSHDLRAPVRAITSFAQAFMEDNGAALASEGKVYINKIIAAGERMDKMLQSLLEYSRVSRAELKTDPVQISSVVNAAVDDLEAEIILRHAVVELKEPLPQVLANRQMLAQCFFNLISNSIKYVAPGVQPRVVVRAESKENKARIWVEDNGVGIAGEYHEKIFGMFERLHVGPLYPGTGIGLTIVKKAIERMGGKVGLQSSGKEGTKFWIELPLA